MKNYIEPQLEIELFEAQDVIATSLNPTDPTQPSTQDSTDPYVNDPF